MAKVNAIREPRQLITTWYCSACNAEHGILLKEATLTQKFSSTPRLHLGTADLRCPNDSIKETDKMCGCDCHQTECMTSCSKCNCWLNDKPVYRKNQKVRIEWADGSAAEGYLTSGLNLACAWGNREQINVKSLRAESGTITILEEPRIDQPVNFGAAVLANASFNTASREAWLRSHRYGGCGPAKVSECRHWRNSADQVAMWINLIEPELIREGL